MKKYRFIAFAMFFMELGTVGALECDNIGIGQALVQLLMFGIVMLVSLYRGGLFNDNV